MILNNVKVALAGYRVNIDTAHGKIAQISPDALHVPGKLKVKFDNAIVFPGLINSHDHLDFNLFTTLGDKKYNNYTEWGHYIHIHYEDQINAVLKIPVALRELWGVYKNLLCGVTTVVNHGQKLKINTSLITTYQNCQSIHSVQFEKKWKIALNNPFKKNLQRLFILVKALTGHHLKK